MMDYIICDNGMNILYIISYYNEKHMGLHIKIKKPNTIITRIRLVVS